MNPATDTGATEFLANLSVGAIVSAALVLTMLRLLILQAGGAMRPRAMNENSLARGLAEILESLIIAGVLVFLIIRPFFVQAFFIPSESMENTLLGHDAGPSPTGVTHKDAVHDHIFVNKLVYRYSHPQREDIIVFRAPKSADGEHKNSGTQVENVLIKRLIGIPGDTIEVKDGRVYRNGKPLDEPYIKEPMDMGLEPNFIYGTSMRGGPIKLGPHELWAMGDNRNDSNDSRYWGPLEDWRVIGKASVIFWPPSRLRMLR